MNTYNANLPAEAEVYRQTTGVTAPLIWKLPTGTDYAGARLEDLVVVDQKGIVRLYISGSSEDQYYRVNEMVDALIKKNPVISLSLRQLYFGQTINVGESKTTTLNIDNTGPGAFEITGYTAPDGVTMEPASLTVNPYEKASVKITLTPTQTGTFSGSVTLRHGNNAVETLQVPILSVSVEGQVFIPADPRADFDGSGKIDFSDFLSFVRVFGTSDAIHDLDGSGRVDFGDFLIFTRSFGKPIG